MFKSQNFCHIASNNRNNVKAGMFIYRTTDDLATVTANGYFNERIIDLNLHDIIVHEQIDNSDPTKVKQNFLCVVQKTLTNVNTQIMDTDEVDGANTDLSNLSDTGKANISAEGTYDPNETYNAGTVGAAISNKADSATTLSGYGITDGANTDLSNLTSTGANIANWSNNVSNCITEIPQDIKVSYSGSTLTIKKGSKLYYPNGTGVFDNVVLENDETYTLSGTNTFYVFRRNASGTSGYFAATLSSVQSGTPDSSTSGVVFYDTTNNRIDWYESGVRNDRLFSFPVCKITVSSDTITSIDEVFNGFGFVGNVIYALPGVKGLMPNGRNADGTAKRYLVNTSSVVLYKETSAKENYKLAMSNLGNWISSIKDCYIDYNNELRRVTDNAVVYSYVFGEFSSNATGKITNFNTKRVFFGLDANDTEYISNQAMPSKRYIDLTLGTSGDTYTAPADGYFMFQKQASGDAQYANVVNNTNGLSTVGYPNANNYSVRLFLPVSKGDVVAVNYTLTGTTNTFRFVYANGAK